MPSFIIQAVITLASMAYQQNKMKKMKRAQEAAADERKGFIFSKSGEAASIPVVYGKQYVGGNQVAEKINNGYTAATDTSDSQFYKGLGSGSQSGTKNEFLVAQYVICQGGIDSVKHVKVDGVDYDKDDAKFQHRISCFNDEGTSPVASNNGLPVSNRMTGCAHATGVFKLNRDEQQYNGIPELEFMVRGRRIRSINRNSTPFGFVYNIGTLYSYSNNPALVLLDYLTNSDFGRGLSEDEIDLESFYNAAQVCDRVVLAGAKVAGKINNGNTTDDIHLYEANITLDPSKSLRDNIVRILECMPYGEMTWTTEGKYKLSLEYPQDTPEALSLVDSRLNFTSEDIVRDSFGFSFPSADSRLNQVTISFLDEHSNFKENTFTYPKTGSTTYNNYLTEDNNQPHRSQIPGEGITEIYHAEARAKFYVERSRSLFNIDFTLNRTGLRLEPGDFISINSTEVSLNGEIFRVESVKFMEDFTVQVSAYFFDFNVLTWSAQGLLDYPAPEPTFNLDIERPASLTFTEDSSNTSGFVSGKLDWPVAEDISVINYLVEASNDGGNNWFELGRTQHNTFDVLGLKTDTWRFAVTSLTRFQKRSNKIETTDSSIVGTTVGRVVVVYADSSNEATNNQSYTLTDQEFVAYHVTTDETDPALPITSDITFTRFIGADGEAGNPNAWWDMYFENGSQWDSNYSAFDSTTNGGWWYSNNALNSGEFMQFTVLEAGIRHGLTDFGYNPSADWGLNTNLDYWLQFGATTFQVYRQNSDQGSPQPYSLGDTFAMGYRDDGTGVWSVEIYKNGVLAFTEAVGPSVADAKPYWAGSSMSVVSSAHTVDIGRVNIAERGIDGIIGSDGLTAISVSIYTRSYSLPIRPVGGEYSFTSLALTTVPNGWSSSIPVGDDPVWVSNVVASTTDLNTTDTTLVWSDASLLVENGADGAAGAPGSDGGRGAGWWRYEDTSNASTYYDSDTLNRVNAAFLAATGLSPTDGDRLVIKCTDTALAYIYDYNSNQWETATEFVDGNFLVTGTVTAAALETDQLDAYFVTIGTLRSAASGARVEISDDVIKVFDDGGVLRVKLGNLNA